MLKSLPTLIPFAGVPGSPHEVSGCLYVCMMKQHGEWEEELVNITTLFIITMTLKFNYKSSLDPL